MIKKDFLELVQDCQNQVQKNIEDDYICLTIGASVKNGKITNWNYQTGDNSFSGGAYGFFFWGVVNVYLDSDCKELAKDLESQILDQAVYS